MVYDSAAVFLSLQNFAPQHDYKFSGMRFGLTNLVDSQTVNWGKLNGQGGHAGIWTLRRPLPTQV